MYQPSIIASCWRRVFPILLLILIGYTTTAQPLDSMLHHWRDDKPCMDWVIETYTALPADDRIGQAIMIAAYTDTPLFNMYKVEAMVKQGLVGGVIFFKGHPSAQLYWTNRLQAQAKVPLLTAIDGEWGPAMRLDSLPIWPHQLTLGAINDNSMIRDMGYEIGRECHRLGIQVNFAPVIDINNNPLNPVIGDRSFGEDKLKVSIKGWEYADGLQQAGVLACAKHFPGHGDTDKDSHKGLPTIAKPIQKLEENELYPFKALFNSGIGSVMVAHLNVPALDPSGTPASLSRKITTKLLKEKMGYGGLVFSDALNMKGASAISSPGSLDSMAFVAGNDILVYSQDPALAIKKIGLAVSKGSFSQDEMDERLKKILAYKYMLGLKEWQPMEPDNLVEDLNPDSVYRLRNKLYESAITIPINEGNLIPIRNPAARKTISLSIDCKGISAYQRACYQFAEMPLLNAPNEGADVLNPLFDKVADYERVLIDLHGVSMYATKNYGVAETTIDFINKLNKKTQVILTLFGSPYVLKFFDEVKNVIVAYEDNEATQFAAANALYGGLRVSGTLPVTASTIFKMGMSQMTDSPSRLKIAMPEEAGIKTEDLRELDEIALSGIISHAYPGCQVLVAKGGKVIWNKSYGNMTYDKGNDKVQTGDLYDLASVSKIAATTLAVMKLYDEGRLDIHKTVADYVPLDDSATIKNIVLADLLTHQAGLKAFFEFFRSTIDSDSYERCYRPDPSDSFSVPVCERVYIRRDYPDTMWRIMSHSPVRANPEYLYSDLDFYILQKVVEHITAQSLDKYVSDSLYTPMGLTRIGYLPLRRFPAARIAPTENDKIFRRQQVQGYVHDPGSAMYGGVAGHAGVFSNAFDLAQVMQMLLNKGFYNGQRLLSEETVKLFTSRYSTKSRRGLGFDKSETTPNKIGPCYDKVPASVFGHTGFTGTCVWSDPDHNLTFIFLSNRVYPDANNPLLVKMGIRNELQKIVYKAMERGRKK